MNFLSLRLSRAAPSVAQSIALSQGSQILDQFRNPRASYSLFSVSGRPQMHQIRTQHTTLWTLQLITNKKDLETWKRTYQVPIATDDIHEMLGIAGKPNRTSEETSPITKYIASAGRKPYEGCGFEHEVQRIRGSSDANLRVLCSGLIFFSIIGTIRRILGLLSEDPDSENLGKEEIILPGFLGKCTLEVIDTAGEDSKEERDIRQAHHNKVTIYKMPKPRSRKTAKETTTLHGDSRSWMPAFESLMFVYP